MINEVKPNISNKCWNANIESSTIQTGWRIDKEIKKLFDEACERNDLKANKTLEKILLSWIATNK